MNAASQRRLTPILVALLAAFGGLWLLLLAGFGSHPHWSAASPSAQASTTRQGTPLPPPLRRSQFAVIWLQPLFNPDRKPVAQSVDNGSIGELELTGVILTPTLHMALLHDREGDRQLRLHSGEALPGGNFTLVEVRPRSAVFDTPGGRVELRLPAGAPIDGRAPVATEAAPQVGPAAGQPALDAPPAPASADASPDQQVQRIRALRNIIQKRRAAQAAAIHEGEH